MASDTRSVFPLRPSKYRTTAGAIRVPQGQKGVSTKPSKPVCLIQASPGRLEIKSLGNLDSADFAGMSQEMGHLLQENVQDPNLRAWLIPS